MVSTPKDKRNNHCYVSILNIIQGEVDPTQVRVGECVVSSQKSTEDKGAKVGQLYPLGKTVQQYDRLRNRGAFLEQFKKTKMFSDGLDEFDSAREANALTAVFARIWSGQCSDRSNNNIPDITDGS
eukprot:sb/3475525/